MSKNNVFTHKFLPILGLVFFIFFILFFNSNVLAVNYDTSNLPSSSYNWIKNCTIKFNDIYPREDNYEGSDYFISFTAGDIYNPDDTLSLRIIRVKNMTFSTNLGGTFLPNNSSNYYYYEINFNYNSDNLGYCGNFVNNGTKLGTSLGNSNTLYISFSNPYFTINTDDSFFQLPPVMTGVIAPIAEKMEMELTLKEIIVILPLIIVVLVSLVGLRKALKMLSTLLRRCLIISIL